MPFAGQSGFRLEMQGQTNGAAQFPDVPRHCEIGPSLYVVG